MCATTQRDSEVDGGSGGSRTPEPRYLVVGRVLRPHGVRGELRVEVLTDSPERLSRHAILHLAPSTSPDSARPYPVENLRWHANVLLLKLAGCDDRDAADELRDHLVQVSLDQAAPLEDGEYYHYQLVGSDVQTESGESLGRLAQVLVTGANDVYVVHGPRGEVLLPATSDVVLEIDVEAKRMIVRPLPGMLPEDAGA